MGWRRLVRRPARFRVSTLMLAVALAAFALAAATIWIPRYLWERRVERLLAGKLASENAPFAGFLSSLPPFPKLYGLTPADLDDLRHDPSRIAEALAEQAVRGDDERRRHAAVFALGQFIPEVRPAADHARIGLRWFDQAVGGDLPPEVEARSVQVAAMFLALTGLDDARLARARGRARAVLVARRKRPGPPVLAGQQEFQSWLSDRDKARMVEQQANPPAHHWASLLAVLGGPRELAVLREAADDPGASGSEIARRLLLTSGLRDSVRYVRRWLGDPSWVPAPHELDPLARHPEGRELLLELALDGSRPDDLRRRALARLIEHPPAAGLLREVLADPARAGLLLWYDSVAEARYRSPDALARSLDHRRDACDRALWDALIDRVAVSGPPEGRPARSATQALQPDNSAEALGLIRRLSGRDDLGDQAAATAWVEEARPAFPLADFLDQLADRPDLLRADRHGPTLYSRLKSLGGRLESLPPGSAESLARLASLAPVGGPEHWDFAFDLLLAHDAEGVAVPGLIDQLASEADRHPENPGARRLRPLQTLRDRFGVNHFWDADAWRAWWAAESARRPGPAGLRCP